MPVTPKKKRKEPVPKEPVSGKPQYSIGVFEIKRMLTTIIFSGIALGTQFITQENIAFLWNAPGKAAAIALVFTGLLKLVHEVFMDNTKKKV